MGAEFTTGLEIGGFKRAQRNKAGINKPQLGNRANMGIGAPGTPQLLPLADPDQGSRKPVCLAGHAAWRSWISGEAPRLQFDA